MVVDRQLQKMFAELFELRGAAMPSDTANTLRGGGGDGTSGGMDQRMTRLEGQFDRMSEKLDAMRGDLAEVKTTLRFMPSRFEFYGAIATATGIIVAAVNLLR